MIGELIQRVEKATGPDREIDADVEEYFSEYKNLGGWWREHKITKCRSRFSYVEPSKYTASLDAIVALVERELPDWRKQLFEVKRGQWRARLISQTSYVVSPHEETETRAPTPALALLLAFLKAKATP